MIKCIQIVKKPGETPLEALECFRNQTIDSDAKNASYWRTVPMTYAGRLDPMAEGTLLVLIGDECQKKNSYLDLNKEYEVEIIFGISTDTYDALGIPLCTQTDHIEDSSYDANKCLHDLPEPDLSKYLGKFIQPYPPYSSKTVSGKHLHQLSRNDCLPLEMPSKEVEIFSLEYIDANLPKYIASSVLLDQITNRIDMVKGDFRQNAIKEKWRSLLSDKQIQSTMFPIRRIKAVCSSGTYMRSLAHRIGADAGSGAFAFSIKRTRIFTK